MARQWEIRLPGMFGLVEHFPLDPIDRALDAAASCIIYLYTGKLEKNAGNAIIVRPCSSHISPLPPDPGPSRGQGRAHSAPGTQAVPFVA